MLILTVSLLLLLSLGANAQPAGVLLDTLHVRHIDFQRTTSTLRSSLFVYHSSLITYLINSSSRYLGSVQRPSSTIISNLSISWRMSSIFGHTVS